MSLINLPSLAETKRLDGTRAKRLSTVAEIKDLHRMSPSEADERERIEAGLDRLLYAHPRLVFDIYGSASELPHAAAQRVWANTIRLSIRQRGRAAVVADLLAEAAESRPFGKLSREQREAQERELRTKLLDIERAEEIEVCRLEDAGYSVVRRADIDAQLVLSVWDEVYGDADEAAGGVV